jgi:DNA primase
MSYRIPKNKVEEILSKVDLIDIAGRYLKLVGNGNGKYSICPFHRCPKFNHVLKKYDKKGQDEKTPSLCFQHDVQRYYCFGCGRSGNAIKFIMKYEKVSFIKAVRKLSNISGVKLK